MAVALRLDLQAATMTAGDSVARTDNTRFELQGSPFEERSPENSLLQQFSRISRRTIIETARYNSDASTQSAA
jgi:hypothetical protein